jgi:hypothetical protein
VILETYTNFTIGMGRDSQPGFAYNTPLAEIDITTFTRIKYADVYTLILSWTDVGSNDDKVISMSSIPNTLCWGILVSWEIEFDC